MSRVSHNNPQSQPFRSRMIWILHYSTVRIYCTSLPVQIVQEQAPELRPSSLLDDVQGLATRVLLVHFWIYILGRAYPVSTVLLYLKRCRHVLLCTRGTPCQASINPFGAQDERESTTVALLANGGIARK